MVVKTTLPSKKDAKRLTSIEQGDATGGGQTMNNYVEDMSISTTNSTNRFGTFADERVLVEGKIQDDQSEDTHIETITEFSELSESTREGGIPATPHSSSQSRPSTHSGGLPPPPSVQNSPGAFNMVPGRYGVRRESSRQLISDTNGPSQTRLSITMMEDMSSMGDSVSRRSPVDIIVTATLVRTPSVQQVTVQSDSSNTVGHSGQSDVNSGLARSSEFSGGERSSFPTVEATPAPEEPDMKTLLGNKKVRRIIALAVFLMCCAVGVLVASTVTSVFGAKNNEPTSESLEGLPPATSDVLLGPTSSQQEEDEETPFIVGSPTDPPVVTTETKSPTSPAPTPEKDNPGKPAAPSGPNGLTGTSYPTMPPSSSPPVYFTWKPTPSPTKDPPTQSPITPAPTTQPPTQSPITPAPTISSPAPTTLAPTTSPMASPPSTTTSDIALAFETQLYDTIYAALPPSTLASTILSLQNSASPQHQAFQWLKQDEYLLKLLSASAALDEDTAGTGAGRGGGTRGRRRDIVETKEAERHRILAGRITQRFALAAFYFATHGNYWMTNTGWLSESHECNWFTAAAVNATTEEVDPCNGGHFLETLDLHENNAFGNIPVEIVLLTNLKTLNLADNILVGRIPNALGSSISNLETLDLQSNQLAGDLPSDLGNLEQLSSMKLSNNQFSGGMPVEWSQLQNLHHLWVHMNPDLSGNIPPEYQNLRNLEQLWLYGTALEGVFPAPLCDLQITNILQPPEVDCPSISCSCCVCYEEPSSLDESD